MKLRLQFYIKFRGRVDVFVHTDSRETADQIARDAINDALAQFERRWPAPKQHELHLVGGEPA